MTEMSKVEEVARAMHKKMSENGAYGYIGDADNLSDVVIDDHVNLLAVARVAIAAMRVPTEAMAKAGEDGTAPEPCKAFTSKRQHLKGIADERIQAYI